VLILLTFLVLLNSSNLWKNLTVDSTSDVLLLYSLSSLNFVSFVVFAFIFGRSLLKLLQERRALQIGSKTKTRLLVYFFAIILLPLIVMPVFSYLFMNRAMDRWFTQTPEIVIRRAGDLQKRTAEERILKFRQTTAMLAEALDKQNIGNADLQTIIDSGGFARIELVSDDLRTIAFAEKPLDSAEAADLKSIVALVGQGKRDDPSFSDGKGFDVAMAEISGGRRLVTISDVSSMENLSQIVQNSLIELDDQKTVQQSIRRNGLLILGFVSFLLIFAAFWMASYVAKGLTRPILALAEGAEEITQGNLGYQVDVFADDELDVLVKAFNEMSGKLVENSAELKERRKYIETVLQSLSTGVISFDDENRITTINKAAVKMFKLEDADFSGLEFKQLVSEKDFLILERLIMRAKRIGYAAEQTSLQPENTDMSTGKNDALPVALTASALPNENGSVLVIEDLSELIAAQRASAWQEVARRMAHEIKNPLTPIQLSAERIAKRFATNNGDGDENTDGVRPAEFDSDSVIDKNAQVIKDGTDTILREVFSLKSMVDEFSRFARLPDIKLERRDLNKLIEKATMLYDDRVDDIVIETKLAGNLPSVLIDEEQLKRVFVNLIDNSIEAFEELQNDKGILIKTWSDSARNLVVTELSDSGKGIPPSDFQKLFQPYFSTKGRGTGLGLAIVQRIISEHGGKIKVVSNTPKGTKFIVELPTDV